MEYAVYLRSLSGFAPLLKLYDASNGSVLATSLGKNGDALVTFVNAAGLAYKVQATITISNETRTYEIALYPVLRECLPRTRNLDTTDPRDNFRSNGVFYADDYLLQ